MARSMARLMARREKPACRVCGEKPRYELLDNKLDLFHLCAEHFICFDGDEVKQINVYIPVVQDRMIA